MRKIIEISWRAIAAYFLFCRLAYAASLENPSERNVTIENPEPLTISRVEGPTVECLVMEDSAWPVVGNCTSERVLQVHLDNDMLKTNNGNCLIPLTMITGPEENITRPYLADCDFANETAEGLEKFDILDTNGTIKVMGRDLCLRHIPEHERVSFGPDTHFTACSPDDENQNWQLSKLTEANRTPGPIGDIIFTSESIGQNTTYSMHWKRGLPDNVNMNQSFTVRLCLESFPEGIDLMRQCITKKNWWGSSMTFVVPTTTSLCRRHFEVTYSNENGWGEPATAFLGCVGRYCPSVCFTEGSQWATEFPQMLDPQ